ncbi:MAG TPA: hypothetical protein VHJ82_09740 [Actinomycetota bacterium]|nr:hypothetical protein [Actinomycetota bacterium]
MKRITVALLLALSLLALPGTSAAQPAGDISDNVEFVANIPEMRTAIALQFIGDTMFVSTETGLFAYSISDPSQPSLIGALPMYIYENEDMEVDVKRNLIFIARDPRGFVPGVGNTLLQYGAIHIIDVSLPHAMVPVSSFLLPVGHTTTCVNDCDFLWTGGPAKALTQPADWTGRPIFATDISDPANPVQCPEPIDTGRHDGQTSYVHDVWVDQMGIAWTSGRGGVRGYWTSGRHRNPLTGKIEKATGCDPVPYAGGGTPEEVTVSSFMHNAWRDLDARAEPGAPKGSVVYATEENISSACPTAGKFVTYDLRGSYNGEGWRNIEKTKYRMKILDFWTPEEQPGSTGCASAHWFTDRGDGVLAFAFYGQGTRFLDVSNPRDIRQIGYYRPDDANAWAAYWYDGYVYVPDNLRGVDILKFKGGPKSPVTQAPPRATPLAALPMDPAAGYLCPLR